VAEQISAEEGALQRGAQAVQEAKAAIDQKTRRIQDEIEGMRPYWQGAAAVAYNQLMTDWHQKTTRLNDTLVQLEESLRGTASDQETTNADQQQTITGLNSMLG
jgi:WXG100 family type VII secretion target